MMLHRWVSAVTMCMMPLFFLSGQGAEIIGGSEAEPHSLPSMALLENSSGQAVCGGSLIHPKWVLTAAHCSDITKVVLGAHSIKEEEKNSRQVVKVQRHVAHPCYDYTEKVNDLMLLKLAKEVRLTQTVKALSVATEGAKDPPPGSSCVVAGWGRTNNQVKKMSDVLMVANVTVIDRMKCNSAEYYNLSPIITQGMICAGSEAGKRSDTCQGDSGGPLLCDGLLVGVTSFGRRCGIRTKPGVYQYLSKKQMEWINNTIRKSDF